MRGVRKVLGKISVLASEQRLLDAAGKGRETKN
jgi:hypothetical protein